MGTGTGTGTVLSAGGGEEGPFLYAGGKIMVFLSRAPDELGSAVVAAGAGAGPGGGDGWGKDGTGGFGGTCAEVGRRFGPFPGPDGAGGGGYLHGGHDDGRWKQQQQQQQQRQDGGSDRDYDPETGQDRRGTLHDGSRAAVPPLPRGSNPELALNTVGIRCAEAALGVEVFVLRPAEPDPREVRVGLALLRLLSDRSGGCGPLLVRYGKCATQEPAADPGDGWNSSVGGTVGALLREILQRCPWGRQVAFGSMLRIRMSPALRIDESCGENPGTTKPAADAPLAALYKTNGFFGPLSPSEEKDLMIMGCCDDSATFVFDVDIVSKTGSVNQVVHLEEAGGDYQLLPCLQSCFAYTTVTKLGSEWVTVRRLRVLTAKMEPAFITEDILASLDAEALAVVLFHKLALSSMQDGLEEAQHLAQDWLLSTLLCTYRSAEVYNKRRIAESERYIPSRSINFYPAERLLCQKGGELSDRDVLLAQGHDRVSSLPLLVFALLQCDALRPSRGLFCPSTDARAAAAANMGSMPPDVLARCIAPRIEVWVEGCGPKDEPLVESLSMNDEALRMTLRDLRNGSSFPLGSGKSASQIAPVLLLDSPRQVVLVSCDELYGERGEAATSTTDDIGPMLRSATQETLDSYRSTPPVLNCFGGEAKLAALDQAALHLKDALVEDSVSSLSKESFQEWCTAMSHLLHLEIKDASNKGQK